MKDKFQAKLAQLLCVRNLITIIMTVILCLLLTGDYNPNKEIMTLYCTAYGAIIAYFFTKGDD